MTDTCCDSALRCYAKSTCAGIIAVVIFILVNDGIQFGCSAAISSPDFNSGIYCTAGAEK